MISARSFTAYFVLLFLALSLVLVLVSMQGTGGRLIYVLDDPYIHLAVAENILKGGYGVNFPEVSSPSSSILYPFLLSLTLFLGFGEWGPLLLGLGATVLSILLVAPLLFRTCVGTRPGAGVLFVVMPPLFLLALNAFVLPLTGMEHPLHVLAVVLILCGLVDYAETGKVSIGLGIGILLGPLIRFEGFAFSVAAILALLFTPRWRAGLLIGVLLVALTVCYVLFAKWTGLPLLPSSVLVKSRVTSTAYDRSMVSALADVYFAVRYALSSKAGALIAVGGSLLLPFCFSKTRYAVPAIALCALLAAHLAFGNFGWFGRYEIYAITGLCLGIAVYYGHFFLNGTVAQRVLVIPCLLITIAVMEYVELTFRVPAASRNIYEQQYQMHRFATEFFPERVAVNDLGWVTYRNDLYVLDLWGLGSEDARRAVVTNGRNAEFMREITQRNDIVYAMIYDAWFEDGVPPEWCRIAQLDTIKVVADSGEVAFYLLDPGREAEMRSALEAFSHALPNGPSLEIYPCNE